MKILEGHAGLVQTATRKHEGIRDETTGQAAKLFILMAFFGSRILFFLNPASTSEVCTYIRDHKWV